MYAPFSSPIKVSPFSTYSACVLLFSSLEPIILHLILYFTFLVPAVIPDYTLIIKDLELGSINKKAYEDLSF